MPFALQFLTDATGRDNQIIVGAHSTNSLNDLALVIGDDLDPLEVDPE